jgi:hypothetical protein
MMKKRFFASGALLLAAMLATGTAVCAQEIKPVAKPSAPVKSPEPVANPTPLRGADVFLCETDSAQCRGGGYSFNIRATRDLYVFVVWPKLNGDYTQTVEFYLPDGSLYVRKSTDFRVRAGQSRARPGVNSTLPERYFTTSRGSPTVVTHLPVAGTFITQRALTGSWTIRLLLNGQLINSGRFQFTEPAPAP